MFNFSVFLKLVVVFRNRCDPSELGLPTVSSNVKKLCLWFLDLSKDSDRYSLVKNIDYVSLYPNPVGYIFKTQYLNKLSSLINLFISSEGLVKEFLFHVIVYQLILYKLFIQSSLYMVQIGKIKPEELTFSKLGIKKSSMNKIKGIIKLYDIDSDSLKNSTIEEKDIRYLRVITKRLLFTEVK